MSTTADHLTCSSSPSSLLSSSLDLLCTSFLSTLLRFSYTETLFSDLWTCSVMDVNMLLMKLTCAVFTSMDEEMTHLNAIHPLIQLSREPSGGRLQSCSCLSLIIIWNALFCPTETPDLQTQLIRFVMSLLIEVQFERKT